MLNIENKYKAFHISIYPHTSPTAGLNMFFFVFFLRKHFIQGGRKDAYTHLHMQMNMSTPAIKPEVQTTIPSKSIHKKEEKKNAPTQIYQLVQGPLSEQAAVKDVCRSQF